ncbi:MinD/ParA family ATP-binding protein [Nocardia albiluteola]|uniref:MinD/ParA family ATP-binding protein n=1 Tax=Nocardia albiluteola TaxID=2842303 RepID=UPI0027DFC23F|nr:MinD/ParA family protein [Nocardia albiluteola]
MSNELPMLPPWLSEGEASQSGYEAPVQNLPQQSLIAEKAPRRRFGRKADAEKSEPESLKNSGKKKKKGKSEEAPEQRPWGEPQQEWGQPQSEAAQNFSEGATQTWSAQPDGAAPQLDPQLRPPNAPHPNGDGGGFAPNGQQLPQGFPPPGPDQQHLAQGFPGQEQYGPGPQGGFPGQQPPPGMPPQGPRQSGPIPQVPPPNRPPIPEAPQAFSGQVPDAGDAGEMTVKVGGRPDLPPPPEAPQRLPLPEPPGPGELAPPEAAARPHTAPPQPFVEPVADEAPPWLESPESAAAQVAPAPVPQDPKPAAPQPDTAARPDSGNWPVAQGDGDGRHRAFDTPAPTHPGPEADQTVMMGRQVDQNAPAPYPPGPQNFPQGPPNGYAGQPQPGPPGQQQPPQGFGSPPQGFGPSPTAPGPITPADPRFAPPGPPPGQQWQSPPGQPAQYQGQHPYQQQPPPQQQFRGPQGGPQPSLDDVPVRRAKKAPGTGWRRTVHHVTGGAINPGMSAEERRLQELVARIRQPVQGDYRIAVLSLKGGVGKTTTTMGIGSIFASIRGDRVIAVDANPDFGTLSQRVQLQTRSTVRDLLLDPAINSYGDVRRHTSQGTSRLEVLASERDPAASESFSEDEYRQVARILQRFYNIILTDCGTGLMHSAMAGVLELAHSLVLISSSAIDGARSAAATLDWLSLHGHDHLVRNAVVVINLPRPGSPNVGIQQLREYFLSRCRAVHIIPYDPHLSEGAEIELARLHKNTKRALVELAATVADDFATEHRRFTY